MTPTTEIVPLRILPVWMRRYTQTGTQNKYDPWTDKKGSPVRFLRGHRKLIPPTVEDAAPFKIDGAYCRLILLTCGQYTIVWESDYRWLMQWKWCASWSEDTKSFYAERRGTGGARIKMHRLILGLRSGDGIRTDHRNHLTLDNRRENLIGATPTESQRNRMKPKNNTSGYKGVSWCRRN